MKIFKGFLVTLLANVIVICICCLIVSFTANKIFMDSFVKEIVRNELVVSVSNEFNVTPDQAEGLFEKEETKQLIDKYTELTMNGFMGEDSIRDIELGEDLLQYVKENREYLEEQLDIVITDQMIQDLEDSEEYKQLTDMYKKIVVEGKTNMSSEDQGLIDAYSFVISWKFQLMLVVIIAVILLFVALIQKSYYRWIRVLGISSIIGAVLTSILALGLKLIVQYAIQDMNMNFNFNISPMIIGCILAGVIGILFIVLFVVIQKSQVKREENFSS